MNTQFHEVDIKVVNSYHSPEVINAFYALIKHPTGKVRIVHQFYPETCTRHVEIMVDDKVAYTCVFDMMGNEMVRGLINYQIREDPVHLSRMALRDVYNFLQQNAIHHYEAIVERVSADYRDVHDTDGLVKNIS
jgi:Lhr-like helicase